MWLWVEDRRVDFHGRISLPAEWRREHLDQERNVVIIKMGEDLLIRAKKSQRLSEFFDSVEVELTSDLSDWLRVKRELLSGRAEAHAHQRKVEDHRTTNTPADTAAGSRHLKTWKKPLNLKTIRKTGNRDDDDYTPLPPNHARTHGHNKPRETEPMPTKNASTRTTLSRPRLNVKI
jgi:bifunctional DNA-binding transcriptional regulator/antitoxin component of YhaV-PrlF toxin-antitoxin module